MSFSSLRVAATAKLPISFGAAVPVVESTLESTTGGSTLTVSKPSGTITGDLLVGCFNRDWDGVSFPSFSQITGGWTELFVHEYGGGFQANADAMYWRLVEGGDTTWDFGITGSDNAEAFVLRISGHDPVNPVGDSSFNADIFTNTITFPGIIADRTNGLLVQHPACSDGLGGSGFTSQDAGVVEVHDSAHGSGTTATQHAVGHQPLLLGGPSGVRTWVPGAADNEKRGGGMCWVRPILGTTDLLEFETTTDNLLLEDGFGVLVLEG